MTKKITKPHDLTFKKALENIHVAQGLLQQYLPQKLLSELEMSTLRKSSNSFVSGDLQEFISDVVYEAKIKGHDNPASLCFIIEHLSSPEREMTFRFSEYNAVAMRQTAQQNSNNMASLVHGILIYNGKRPFHGSTDIRYDIDAPNHLINSFLFQPFHLIDLNLIDDEILRHEKYSGFALLAFKHCRNPHLFQQFVDTHLELAQQLIQENAQDLVWIVLKYLLVVSTASKQDLYNLQNLVSTQLSHELGQKMATLAENLKAEGKVEVARNLLIKKVIPDDEVAEITALSKNIIAALRKEIEGKNGHKWVCRKTQIRA